VPVTFRVLQEEEILCPLDVIVVEVGEGDGGERITFRLLHILTDLGREIEPLILGIVWIVSPGLKHPQSSRLCSCSQG